MTVKESGILVVVCVSGRSSLHRRVCSPMTDNELRLCMCLEFFEGIHVQSLKSTLKAPQNSPADV